MGRLQVVYHAGELLQKLLRVIIFSILHFLLLNTIAHSEIYRKVYLGSEIPSTIDIRYKVLFENSDSLYLNDQLLKRGIDYNVNTDSAHIDLKKLSANSNDTLVVTYRTAPNWLMSSFGQPIPELTSPVSVTITNQIPATPNRLQSSNLTNVNISGAKTFRFSSRSAGSSEFGQSLDLNVEGTLAENVNIIGTISDRGYSPTYGTANSRLEELDKVNLRLESPSLSAQVGDIILNHGLFQQTRPDKKISGAAIDFTANNFGLSGVVGRPKGRFSTFRLIGISSVQGPYQVGEGNQARPIVPNSETVWLDGRQLVRGSDNDYTMDYPTGRITFSYKNVIDNRSRIEIDYEPVTTDYKTELLSAVTAYKVGDSSIYAAVEFFREGDDKSQPQLGEISDLDRQLLANTGDNVDNAYRSGISTDTSGGYLFDSTALPDTVLQYVGEGNGTHSVVFSFVGMGNGDYRFVGGKQYVYSGPNGGDYLPIIKIPAPERTDFYTTLIGVNNALIGSVNAELKVSRFDRNLFSSLDDSDNEGVLLNLNAFREFNTNGQTSNFQFLMRTRETTFDIRSRLNAPDFDRNYLLPKDYVQQSDEQLYEAKSVFAVVDKITVIPAFGRLNYNNSFSSNRYSVMTLLGDRQKLNTELFWSSTETDLTTFSIQNGRSNTFIGKVTVPLRNNLKLIGEYENDNRRDNYKSFNQGLRYQRYGATFEHKNEKLSYEYYSEDSLITVWADFSTRNRISGTSIRRFGHFSYNTYLGYQWIHREISHEESFLGRTDLKFNNNGKEINIESSYLLSEETRNARGITYLEVDPGQGDYSLENGRYVPDPDGNFIQVEELLSERSRINRGEKSFLLTKNWSGVQVRFNSRIEEELLEDGSRDFLWLIPFYSDDGQPYLVYNRQYNSEFRLIRIKGGHAINLAFNQRTEIRNLSGNTLTRQDKNGSITLKQVSGHYFFEQQAKVFLSDRDNYFVGAGDINGYQIGANIRRLINGNDYSLGGAFRRATSADDEISQIVSILGVTRIHVIEKGELRNSLELYAQSLSNVFGVPSYLLTDNKRGTKGILWSSSFNYNVRKGMRINLRLSGRHSNESTARITGRGEVVAEF